MKNQKMRLIIGVVLGVVVLFYIGAMFGFFPFTICDDLVIRAVAFCTLIICLVIAVCTCFIIEAKYPVITGFSSQSVGIMQN